MDNKTPISPSGLQIEQDMPYQKRERIIQRIGWCIMIFVLIAALLGFMGGAGPFSTATKTLYNPAIIHITHPQFARNQSPVEIKAYFPVAIENPIIWIDDTYLTSMQLDKITPSPEKVFSLDGKVYFHFSGYPSHIVFYLTTDKAGSQTGRLGIAGYNNFITFQQVTYP